ncbi:MAG: GatB/YqeY domain-containing protein [Firmicutes bacterium]|nr:GatB/YqeY domain-containing protein [Bacillota bacterium]
MSIKDRLMEDMKAAMKAREEGKTRLSVIRLARAAIKNAEVDQMKQLDDAGVIPVLAREVKQRRDAIAEYRNLGRQDAVEALEEEIAILMEYLPEQLSEDDVRKTAEEAIREVGARGPADLGKVMGVLMPKVRGKADGRLVNQVVRSLLEDVGKNG